MFGSFFSDPRSGSLVDIPWTPFSASGYRISEHLVLLAAVISEKDRSSLGFKSIIGSINVKNQLEF